MTVTTLWPSEATLQTLPIIKAAEPVYEFDREAKRFTEIQAKVDGLPVWRLTVLLGTGWAGDLETVECRFKSATRPGFKPNPTALMQLVGATPDGRSN